MATNLDMELAARMAAEGSRMLTEAHEYLAFAGEMARPREVRSINRTVDFAQGLLADAEVLLFHAIVDGADEITQKLPAEGDLHLELGDLGIDNGPIPV